MVRSSVTAGPTQDRLLHLLAAMESARAQADRPQSALPSCMTRYRAVSAEFDAELSAYRATL
jgi:hypothetical protein